MAAADFFVRDDVVLATKFHGPMGADANQRGNSRRWIVKEVENSLRRLGTDHIDLYQVHRPDPSTDVDDTLAALSDLVQQGKSGLLVAVRNGVYEPVPIDLVVGASKVVDVEQFYATDRLRPKFTEFAGKPLFIMTSG